MPELYGVFDKSQFILEEKMKNPIKSIQHLINDPVKSAEELEQRKKKIIPLFLIAAAIPLILLVISLIFSAYFLSFIGLFALILVVMYFKSIFGIMSKLKEKFKALLCDGCNTQIDFSENPDELSKYVTYEILKEETKTSVHSDKSNERGIVPSVKAEITSTAIAQITFTCPKCGKTKTIKYSFKAFECLKTVSNVPARDVASTRALLESTAKEIVSVYDSPERDTIPFSIYSKHHPNFENRFKLQVAGEEYKGFTVKFHVTTDEMVERFMLGDDISGTIITK